MSELQLSPEQRQVIETWDQGMAVQAGAGSGKTTTLVLKCCELLRRNPEARFAAVSFTERSASDLRTKLSASISASLPSRAEGGPLDRHWVMTIHGLCGAILREFPIEAGFDGEESMLSEGEAQLLWERALEQIWTEDPRGDSETEAGSLSWALERLLARESRDSLEGLIRRTRDLESSGMIEFLNGDTDEDARALAILARFVLDRYERLKKRRGALDFNDLEKGADRALDHAHVREALQKRFALVLIDEFQDTNAVQARIILRFVRSDLSNLCVVGDPKQSIYRFRDADVGVFNELCAKLPVQISLTWNFRSRPAILELANHVCDRAFAASGLEYQPLVPQRMPAVQGSLAAEPVVKVPVERPQELARWILSEQARGVPLQDMALLLRKIRGNERWLKALSAAGIPIAVGSGGLFWEDPRTRELVSFLKWWDHPSNSLSGAIFLRAPWVGISDQELDRWHRDDATWMRPFFASEHPLARVLKPLRGKILRPGELLMTLLASTDASWTERLEDELGATLLGLWHRCEDLSSRGLDFHAVVGELARAVQEKRRERDVPPPRNRGQLQVLTLHGAKGLEFPHVILLDLGKKSRASNSPSLYWDRKKGAYLVQKDSSGERIEDEVFLTWKKEEREKELSESKRIFYVALTRARERLVLVCPALEAKDESFDPQTVYGQDFWRGWLEASGVLAQIPEGVHGSFENAEPLAETPAARVSREPIESPCRRRPRHSVTEWNLLSRCPRAYEWTYVRPRLGMESSRVDWSLGTHSSDEPVLSQRELGTQVHAALESGDLAKLDELERRAGPGRFKANVVRDWAQSSPWMNAEIGRFKEAFAELAFEIPIAGEVLVGSMDRVIVDPSDVPTVIDFKVTRHEKSKEALREAYETQMQLYRWALGRLVGATADIRASLVNFSDSGVLEVEVPPANSQGQADAWVENLASLASRIVAGEEAKPRPGKLCELCQFRKECLTEN